MKKSHLCKNTFKTNEILTFPPSRSVPRTTPDDQNHPRGAPGPPPDTLRKLHVFSEPPGPPPRSLRGLPGTPQAPQGLPRDAQNPPEPSRRPPEDLRGNPTEPQDPPSDLQGPTPDAQGPPGDPQHPPGTAPSIRPGGMRGEMKYSHICKKTTKYQ